MNNKRLLLALLACLLLSGIRAQRVSGIYTSFDYNGTGYWHSTGPAAGTANQPGNSHDLLAFTWKGATYTTGVDDARIEAIVPAVPSLVKNTFRSLPVSSLPAPASGTFVGVGVNYTINTANTSMEYYLTDGVRGLNLGTGIYNLPTGKISKYTVQVNTQAFTAPAILITQMGSYATDNNDEFYFVDAAGNVLGQKRIVDFDTVGSVGVGRYKFYNIQSSGLVYNSSVSSSATRDMRLVAFSLADFGITGANMSQVHQFWHKLSGNSDQAFIGAYNDETIKVFQSISGFVYVGGSTPGTPGYAGATVTIYNAAGTAVGSTTTNPAGYYLFGDLAPGNYTIRLTVPNGRSIASASDNQTDENIAVALVDEPVTNTWFSLNQPLPVDFGTITAKMTQGRLLVNWSTLREVNNDRFEVEASANGVNFHSIGMMPSRSVDGNSDTGLYYTFEIGAEKLTAVLGMSFALFAFVSMVGFRNRKWMLVALILIGGLWACSKSENIGDSKSSDVFVRIKQVDKDGEFKYSKTVKATID